MTPLERLRHALGLGVLTASVVAPSPAAAAAENNDTAIRPFRITVPEADLADLRRRVLATRWPDKETVADPSQGVQLAKLQDLVQYWGSGYDWRKVEATLNALPQFTTNIDGLDIYFIHVRSRHKNALPVIITHGWPGSVLELLKVIGPLTDPTAHGGSAEDAFDVVIPSVPGYGFSGKPTGTGWDPDHIARVWAELMKRLGYTRYVAQGGDWGAPISSAMARQTAAWLTNSATSAGRLYWENGARGSVLSAVAQKTAEISLPVAITVFPEDVYRPPETWARRAYRNLIYFHEVDKGGHFAAWEQPELFSAELRAAFRSLR